MLTLLFVPVFYILIDDLGDFVKRISRRVFGGGGGQAPVDAEREAHSV
jgi:hypothetical protein